MLLVWESDKKLTKLEGAGRNLSLGLEIPAHPTRYIMKHQCLCTIRTCFLYVPSTMYVQVKLCVSVCVFFLHMCMYQKCHEIIVSCYGKV